MTRRFGVGPLDSPPLITLGSRLAAGAGLRMLGAGAASSGASPWSDAANSVLAFPFVLEKQTTIYKGFGVTGTSPSGNFEVGIFDDAFAKIVSSGSVAAGAVASIPVMADLTDTTLSSGLYYAGMSFDATTTNRWFRWSVATTGTAFWQLLGCFKHASAAPGSFPSTATPADMTNVAFPLFGLITRSVFDA